MRDLSVCSYKFPINNYYNQTIICLDSKLTFYVFFLYFRILARPTLKTEANFRFHNIIIFSICHLATSSL